jgi:hypothetical protein
MESSTTFTHICIQYTYTHHPFLSVALERLFPHSQLCISLCLPFHFCISLIYNLILYLPYHHTMPFLFLFLFLILIDGLSFTEVPATALILGNVIDVFNQGLWYPGVILQTKRSKVLVHFEAWNETISEWIDKSST